MSRALSYSLVAFSTLVISALAFYLTPLKHLNLIEPRIKDVQAAVIYEQMQKNPDGYLFIDVRPAIAYNREHAKGALNVDLPKLYYERHKLPKKGKQIVLICSGGIASGVAYSYLEHYGFLNLVRVEGGIESWIMAGLPTEKVTP